MYVGLLLTSFWVEQIRIHLPYTQGTIVRISHYVSLIFYVNQASEWCSNPTVDFIDSQAVVYKIADFLYSFRLDRRIQKGLKILSSQIANCQFAMISVWFGHLFDFFYQRIVMRLILFLGFILYVFSTCHMSDLVYWSFFTCNSGITIFTVRNFAQFTNGMSTEFFFYISEMFLRKNIIYCYSKFDLVDCSLTNYLTLCLFNGVLNIDFDSLLFWRFQCINVALFIDWLFLRLIKMWLATFYRFLHSVNIR